MMKTETDLWVDRPRPRFPWPVWVLSVGFCVFFVSFPFWPGRDLPTSGSGPLWIVLSVVTMVAIGWFYFDVIYELDEQELRARTGPKRGRVQITEIVEAEVTPWFTFVLPRNWGAALLGNSWTPMLRIVDSDGRKLLITPTDPEEMRAKILRRRGQLRGGSGSAD